MCSFIESIFIEITQRGKANVLIGCIYRPPNSDIDLFNIEIVTLLSKIDGEMKKLALLAGDYNLDLIKQAKHAPTAEFLNNLTSFCFFPVISNPTRISDFSATLIDNNFINRTKHKMSSAVVHSTISDHLPIALHLETSLITNITPKSVKKRIYDKDSLAHFSLELSRSENWADVYYKCQTNGNTSAAYESFHKKYVDIFEKCFPEKIIKLSHRLTPRHPWMTKRLVRSCLKKSKLYGIYRKTRSETDKSKYIAYKNKLVHLLNTAEKSYYFEKIKSLPGNLKRPGI
jgi:hypothetical protein